MNLSGVSRSAIIVLMSLALFTGCASHPPLATVEHVDLDRFMGDWYVIANIPTLPERGARNSLEQYDRREDGDVDITFSFDKGEDEERKVMRARGFVQEGSGNARWKVQFLWPFRAPFYVMDLDPEYSYTVIGLPSRKYLWIMAREETMADSVYQTILGRVASVGYDTTKVQRVEQEWSEARVSGE